MSLHEGVDADERECSPQILLRRGFAGRPKEEWKVMLGHQGSGRYRRRKTAFRGRKGRDLLFVSFLINCARSIYLHDLI